MENPYSFKRIVLQVQNFQINLLSTSFLVKLDFSCSATHVNLLNTVVIGEDTEMTTAKRLKSRGTGS